MKAEIKQLPVTTNLANLDESELVNLANTKYEAGIDALIKAAYCVKECGEALQELKTRYISKGQSKKDVGFGSLFRSGQSVQTQLKLSMSRRQADRYIAVAKAWSQIEPKLQDLKARVLRNGRISPKALLDLLDAPEVQEQVQDSVETIEVEVEVIKEVPAKAPKIKQDKPTKKELELARKIAELENQVASVTNASKHSNDLLADKSQQLEAANKKLKALERPEPLQKVSQPKTDESAAQSTMVSNGVDIQLQTRVQELSKEVSRLQGELNAAQTQLNQQPIEVDRPVIEQEGISEQEKQQLIATATKNNELSTEYLRKNLQQLKLDVEEFFLNNPGVSKKSAEVYQGLADYIQNQLEIIPLEFFPEED